MEENLSWKIVYLATIFSLIILGIAYYLISPRESTYFSPEKTEKVAEFENTRVEGRKEGKRVWEFFAKAGWTAKDQEITYLTGVSQGQIFRKDGTLVVHDLRASQVRVFRHTEIVEAFGSAEAKAGLLTAYLDLGKFAAQPKNKSDWTRLTADYIKYIPAEKRSEILGHVILAKRGSLFNGDRINVNHDQKIADISGNIYIKRKDGILQADAVQYLGETEQINADRNVKLNLRENKIRTFIRCNYAQLSNDTEKDIILVGSLEVLQGKKLAVAPEGIYSKTLKGLILRHGAKATLEKAAAILKAETVKKLRNTDTKETLKRRTVITADELFFSIKTGDARARGGVVVTLKGHEARADSAVYNDKNEILTLFGNVFMKRGDLWVRCKQVVISVRDETFEASGVAEAKFKL